MGDDGAGGDVGHYNQPHAGVPPHLGPAGGVGVAVAWRNHFHHQVGNQAGDVGAVGQGVGDVAAVVEGVVGGADGVGVILNVGGGFRPVNVGETAFLNEIADTTTQAAGDDGMPDAGRRHSNQFPPKQFVAVAVVGHRQ